MSDTFIQARRTLMELMNPSRFRAACIRYLQEGGELDEAEAMQNCSIEYGEVRDQRGSVYEIDITLRCKRELQEKLKPRTFVFSSEDIKGAEIMSRLTEALNASLPSGYQVANAEARAISGAPAPTSGVKFFPPGEQVYDELTEAGFLTSLGRGAVDGLLFDFVPDFQRCGLSLPMGGLSDADYFAELAKALRCEGKLPVELRARISKALRTFRLSIPVQEREVSQEVDGFGTSLRLVKSETGRGLIRIVVRCVRMHHDFAESLTHAQQDFSSGFLDHLRASIDGHEEVGPDERKQAEHSTTERLQRLEESGLQVFAGTFCIQFWSTEYESFPGKVAVVIVVSRDDPRIRRDEGGLPFIEGVISNSRLPRNAERRCNPLRREDAAADRTSSPEGLIRGVLEEKLQHPPGLAEVGSGIARQHLHSQSSQNRVSGDLLEETTRDVNGRVFQIGMLKYLTGFKQVWIGSKVYDLQERTKARLCIQFMVESKAFGASSAVHLLDQIDPYVRRQGNFPKAADIKIDHYFKDSKGRLSELRRRLIHSVRRSGRYYLKVE